MSEQVLKISNLVTYFYVSDGIVKAVDGVNLEINKGEVVGVVGESGSGKSVTALAAMRLIPDPPGKILQGEVLFLGEDLMKKKPREMQAIRGAGISMIFQNPHAALNPLLKLGHQLIEVTTRHRHADHTEVLELVLDMLRRVGIKEPLEIIKSYPFNVSAGTCQRVMLAMALLCEPRLLIADEPTTLLDTIAQVEVLGLIKKLKDEMDMAVWYITHDFGAISLMSDRVVVMYAGKPMESADTETVLRNPKHPYAEGLINSVPVPGRKVERLKQIPGEIPNPIRLPPGCSFAPRCPRVMDICRHEEPPYVRLNKGHTVKCWLYR